MFLLLQRLKIKKVSFRQEVKESSGNNEFVTESERFGEKLGKRSEQRKFINITQRFFSFLETVEIIKSTRASKNTPHMLIKSTPSNFLATRYNLLLPVITFAINPKFDYNFVMRNPLIDSGRRPPLPCSTTTRFRLSLSGFQDDSSSIVSCPARTNIRVTDIQRLTRVSKNKEALC